MYRPIPSSLIVRSCGLLLIAIHSLAHAAVNNAQLVEQGQRAFNNGRFSQSAEQWQKALDNYRRKGDAEAVIRTSVSLADAYEALGHYRRAIDVLEGALTNANSAKAPEQVLLAKSRLGAALIMTRELDRAATMLNECLEAAKAGADSNLEGQIQNDLGNVLIAQQKFTEALALYEAGASAALQASNSLLVAQARCNAASAAAQAADFSRADQLNAQALEAIALLTASHAKAFLLLTSGMTDRQIKLTDASAQRLMLRAHHSFEESLKLATQIKDRSVETYAQGYLAQLYEQDAQPDAALALTRQAIFSAQEAQLPEALYRWEWQQGRLLKGKGDHQSAVAAYRRAVQTLQPIRTDVSSGFGNAIRSQTFREAQGPLFLELADLLLLQSRSARDSETEQRLLREARDTVEQLKTVELNDYFCDDCVDVQRGQVRELEAVDQHTAVIYLIPLPTRTEVLVGLGSGLKSFPVEVAGTQLATTVSQFRRNLETRTSFGYLAQAQQLYDWLIRPLRPYLAEHRIDTLVFVPDGALRTIPFASLHDGEKFLIQDLAVAVAPGLSLIAPESLGQRKRHLLIGGLSESVQGFPALDFVPAEMHSLETIYPAEKLVNESFTLNELERKLDEEQFSIIHIASHGQFNRDVHKTFVLTYDTKLTLNTLEALIRPAQYRGRPLELLVLSACQTAAGDDRAALGLAGVAVKAGARSALASLWFVNDQSTSALISEVYRQLRSSPSISKAKALQAAQIKLLNDRRYRHPCYWSPFLLIGNWL
ncbi:MAG TPA: CHAT domain-containing protein [Candidatus Limnocylindrales bacterium]|nr:CHAT domain-containing protein [Candidatus Limnocylindrales bacterium]